MEFRMRINSPKTDQRWYEVSLLPVANSVSMQRATRFIGQARSNATRNRLTPLESPRAAEALDLELPPPDLTPYTHDQRDHL
jgi:hypothetical protein